MAAPPLATEDLLARLVAFDTTSRNSNLPLAENLADYLDRPGVEVRLLPSADGAKANLLVRVGPEVDPEERGGLVLSGHMDVVPADEEGWQSDPFRLTDHGDHWVARGAADMKGFLALAAALARRLDPARLARPLVLLFTYDEEVGCLGAEHLVATAPDLALPRAAVIGEPTGLEVVRMHKGHLKVAVTLRGVAAHSGYPHLGDNAIVRAAAAVGALAELGRELEGERTAASQHFPDVPYPALNVGTIEGGSAINVVPDRCALGVGVRLLPGMESAPLVERIGRRVAPHAGGAGHAVEVLSASPPMALDAEAPVVRALGRLAGRPAARAVSFATDAGWLSRLGLDCAVFGPGSIEVAHKPNEFLPKAELARAERVIEALAGELCGEGAA